MTFDATLVLIDFSPEQPDDSKARKWMSEDSRSSNPSKIEWDLTNGPLRKLLELLDTQV